MVVMKTDTNKDIQLIKETILKNIDAKFIYLFGSYAYGIPNENSDIDVYVVLPENTAILQRFTQK